MLTVIEHYFQQLQFGRKKQQAFLEDFRSLLIDGVPANTAIETIAATSENTSKLVALEIAQTLAHGQQIADGMRRWFSPAVVELVRAGENSGALEKTLASAEESIARQNNAITAFANAVMYPLLVIIVSCLVIVFITNSVLANFAEIKPIAMWPQVGRFLMVLGQSIQTWWLLVVTVIVLLLLCVWSYLQKGTGEFRHLVDSLPVLSLYRRMTAARLMETLGLLISNGIALKKALSIMQTQAQPYFAWHLIMMEYRLSSGSDSVADVLDTQLIEPADLVRLRVVAKGNKGFERALIHLGRQANKKNAESIVMSGKVLGGVMLVCAALIAALTVFAIYSVGSLLAV